MIKLILISTYLSSKLGNSNLIRSTKIKLNKSIDSLFLLRMSNKSIDAIQIFKKLMKWESIAQRYLTLIPQN